MSAGKKAGDDNAVAASAQGATFLILLQIGSRALTFALNQILLRFLTPELLGAALQLEVFVITAHHFARESLRVACQRHPAGGIQAPINLSYLSIIAGIAIVAGLGEWYLHSEHPQVDHYVPALRICQVAAVIELFSEPAFVVVQQRLLYKIRASAEASAVVTKTLATAGLVLFARHRDLEVGVLPFAAGELAYCGTLMLVYLWQTSSVARLENFSLSLRKITPRCVSTPCPPSKHSPLITSFQCSSRIFLFSFFEIAGRSRCVFILSVGHQICPYPRRYIREPKICHSQGSGHVRPRCQLWRSHCSNAATAR